MVNRCVIGKNSVKLARKILLLQMYWAMNAVLFLNAKPSDWYSYERQCAAIFYTRTGSKAGTNGAYNTVNIGFVLGEIVLHVTGKNVGEFMKKKFLLP